MAPRSTGPELPGGPAASQASLDLAADIHAATLSGLGIDVALPGLQEGYGSTLFGALALDLVGAELPSDSTRVDRAKAVAGAIKRIISEPALLEKVLGVAYNPAWFSEGAGLLGIEADPTEAADVSKLRSEIAKNGYLNRSMFTSLGITRPLQLQYAVHGRITHGMRRDQNALPMGSTVCLKLLPATLEFSPVEQYIALIQGADGAIHYEGYTGERKVPKMEAFSVAALSPADLPPSVRDSLRDEYVRIGDVTTGSELKLTYRYRLRTKEVPTRQVSPRGEDLNLPATLQQAYLGNTLDYPLFAA